MVGAQLSSGWHSGSIGDGSAGAVLAHLDGGFVNFGVAPDLAEEAMRWTDAGRSVRVIRAVALN